VTAFARNECGSTAIEYALIATMVSALIVTALSLVGSEIKAMFESIGF
jgi:pilus assembly protein Flp/PilA